MENIVQVLRFDWIYPGHILENMQGISRISYAHNLYRYILIIEENMNFIYVNYKANQSWLTAFRVASVKSNRLFYMDIMSPLEDSIYKLSWTVME